MSTPASNAFNFKFSAAKTSDYFSEWVTEFTLESGQTVRCTVNYDYVYNNVSEHSERWAALLSMSLDGAAPQTSTPEKNDRKFSIIRLLAYNLMDITGSEIDSIVERVTECIMRTEPKLPACASKYAAKRIAEAQALTTQPD